MRNKKRNKYLLLLILLLGISVGYALLSTTLKINGSATITKNNWSVYWTNPVVTDGSVTTTAPALSAEENQTLNTIATWSTTLSLPGDFYEFTIDAVNNGTIDAMIEEIENTVTPTLPSYIRYSVTYADGTTIEEKDLLSKKTGNTATVEKYKVRIEFLNTITPEQMEAIPENGLTYSFEYHIQYVQATSEAKPKKAFALPQGKTATTLALGDEVCAKDQCFNFIRYDGDNAVLLAKYNLNVGTAAKTPATNLQDSEVLGQDYDSGITTYGVVPFSQIGTYSYWADSNGLKEKYGTSYPTNVYDADVSSEPDFTNACDFDAKNCFFTEGYSVAYYVEQYKTLLAGSNYNASIVSARLLTLDEAENSIGCDYEHNSCPAQGVTSFIANTRFWLGTAVSDASLAIIDRSGQTYSYDFRQQEMMGVRPVIVVAKSNL